MGGGIDHIFHTGRFANQHIGRVVFFQDSVQAVDWLPDLITGHLIFRVDQEKLPFVAFQNTCS